MWWMEWLRRRPLTAPTHLVAPDDPRFLFYSGRQYLGGVPYVLPVDQLEMGRLEAEHCALRHALGSHFQSPVLAPERVLDVGSGCGRWALDIAAAFPAAHVVGIDLALPVPDALVPSRDEPANVTFVRASVLEPLPFGDAGFDFVHARSMASAIPLSHWQGVAFELARVTRIGGWVEVAGAGTPSVVGPALGTLHRWTTNFAAQRGIDLAVTGRVATYLIRAGLTSQVTHVTHLSLDTRSSVSGSTFAEDYLAYIASMRGGIVDRGLTRAEDFDETLSRARDELATGAYSLPWYTVYGHKVR